ncbi:ABC transporter permease [Balneatrix alpica]|uniref:ABC transporter permease n=1 Tax=Balneatrix alpica TaxID=75684 RepID=UPI0027387756|nr:ABC transporter permease subunit [Balneatrix alpica]
MRAGFYINLSALLLLGGPVLLGLLATLLPAWGYFPVLGFNQWSWQPWQQLWHWPGLARGLGLSLFTGLTATALSLLLVWWFLLALLEHPWGQRLQRGLAPLLAIPHAALALGLVFLFSPSGWLVRWVSPWASGWHSPPLGFGVQDPWGWGLILGLVLKEFPYLLLVTLAALPNLPWRQSLRLGQSLGYPPWQSWLWLLWPALYRQLRLPLLAVLVYALANVDMALLLGPTTPPTLAVQLWRWMLDADLSWRLPASAGAVLLLGLLLLAVLGWWLMERLLAWLCLQGLRRGWRAPVWPRTASVGRWLLVGLLALVLLALLGLLISSLSWRWPFPLAWPQSWTLTTWQRQLPRLWLLSQETLLLALSVSAVALTIVVLWLEGLGRRGPSAWLSLALYLPLLIPQLSFLFGLQVLLVSLGGQGQWWAVFWGHLLFVLPYVYLSLAGAYQAFDQRYWQQGRLLGLTPWGCWWRVKAPLLLRPLLAALAIGVAVSVAQYLSTLFLGGGRVATLTTEAISLGSGADRRVLGVYAWGQLCWPVLIYALALLLPRWRYRHFAQMRL